MAVPAMRSTVLLLAVICTPGCLGLKTGLTVSVPAVISRGKDASLSCNYQNLQEDADGDRINITWYKDGVKFYDSVNEGLTVNNTVYDVPGIQVDKEESAFRYLALKSLKVNSGGQYRCRASSVKNSVISDIKPLFVVAEPDKDPMISGFRETVWVPNGTLPLNCTADQSFPAAKLKWMVEGEEVDDDRLVPWPIERDDEGRETARLGLNLQLGPDIMTEVVEVACEANFYKKVTDNWSDGASVTTFESRKIVTKTVGPSSDTAVTLGGPAAALLVLLCSLATTMTR